MVEVLSSNWGKIESSTIPEQPDLVAQRYILLLAHWEENIDSAKNFIELMNAVNAMAKTYRMPIIYSSHPRSKKFIENRKFQFHPLVKSLPSFGFSDYNHLQMQKTILERTFVEKIL